MQLIKSNFSPSQFFDDFITREFFNPRFNGYSKTDATLPAVNIIESNDGFAVEMAIPGMSKNDFQIELDNEMLTITSEKNVDEALPEGDRFTRREFSYQSFQRSFHLPKSVVDVGKISAKYNQGILRVLIPKKEEAKALPPRRIKIG